MLYQRLFQIMEFGPETKHSDNRKRTTWISASLTGRGSLEASIAWLRGRRVSVDLLSGPLSNME